MPSFRNTICSVEQRFCDCTNLGKKKKKKTTTFIHPAVLVLVFVRLLSVLEATREGERERGTSGPARQAGGKKNKSSSEAELQIYK